MKTYLISYDLNRPGQDYPDLWDAIKAFDNWWHFLDSTWIVKTNWPATQIRDYLRPYLDDNDELLVVRLSGESAWFGFAEKGSAWLQANIQPTN